MNAFYFDKTQRSVNVGCNSAPFSFRILHSFSHTNPFIDFRENIYIFYNGLNTFQELFRVNWLIFQRKDCLFKGEGLQLILCPLGSSLLVGSLRNLNESVDKIDAHSLRPFFNGNLGNPIQLSKVFPEARVKHILNTVVRSPRNHLRN